MKIIAGENRTETVIKENNILYKLDVARIEFSKGNFKERKRVWKSVRKDEVIVDMFAGIGYFTLPLAKFSQAKLIYAIDLNPKAIEYLKENLRMNYVSHKVVPILGDCRKVSEKLRNVGISTFHKKVSTLRVQIFERKRYHMLSRHLSEKRTLVAAEENFNRGR